MENGFTKTTLKSTKKNNKKYNPKTNYIMNLEFLKQTLAVQTTSRDETMMREYIRRVVRDIEGAELTMDSHGNIFVVKGKADQYPCVVAHQDTVHQIHKRFKVFQDGSTLFAFNGNEQVGIGGDDKVGVAVALTMLQQFDFIKAAFYSQEEMGCIGSRASDISFYDNVTLALQCDRKGNNDFVHGDGWCTELFGNDFRKKVKPILKRHGYKFSDGGLTDVMELKGKGVGIAMANMSCGYYNPHTDKETVNIDDVTNVTAMVACIIEELGSEVQHHEFVRKNKAISWDWDLDIVQNKSSYDEDVEVARYVFNVPPEHEDSEYSCPCCEGVTFLDELDSEYCPDCCQYVDVMLADEKLMDEF